MLPVEQQDDTPLEEHPRILDVDKEILQELDHYNLEQPMKMLSWYHPITAGNLSIREMYAMINHFCHYKFYQED